MSENNNLDEEMKDTPVTETVSEEKTVKKGVATPVFVVVLLIAIIAVIICACLLVAHNNSKQDKKSNEKSNSKATVELGEYKGIEVSVVPTEDDIQEAIQMNLEDNADYEQLQGTVEADSTIYASFKATLDGKDYEDGTGEDYIEIGSGEWIEGFEDGLIGVKTGETKTLNLKFPDDYDDDTVAGKDVTFVVKVEYIAGEEILPEYNDAFVQEVSEGEAKTTAEYEKQLKEELYEENIEAVGDTAWEEVVENSTVNDYPADMMEISKKVIQLGYQDMADMSGVTMEEIMESWGVSEEDFTEMAQEEVADFLLAKEIAKRENIKLEDSEYQEQLEEDYEYYSYDSMEEFEKEMGDYERNMALYNKVIEWVGDNAVVTDKMEE